MKYRKLFTCCAAAAGSLLGWGIFENKALLCVSRYTVQIPGLPRLVQISDLHKRRFGRDQARLIRKVAALDPDYIVITGDLVSRDETDFTQTGRLLKALGEIAPVLTVFGNHETDLPPSLLQEFRQAVRESGAVSINNRMIQIGGLTFAGLALPPEYYRGGGFFGFYGKKECTAETLRERLGSCPENTVLLAHNPLWFPAYAEWGAALTLSGHVHGGMVRLPVIGGLFSPRRTFFPHYDKGAFRQDSAEMIVSGGLGKLRLFNPPELCLITAKIQDPDRK